MRSQGQRLLLTHTCFSLLSNIAQCTGHNRTHYTTVALILIKSHVMYSCCTVSKVNRLHTIPPSQITRREEGRSSPKETPSLFSFSGILNNYQRPSTTFIDPINKHLSDKVIVHSTVLKPEKYKRMLRNGSFPGGIYNLFLEM